MYRPDDNDIDRLSKEAAEHYNAPGAPAWDALRQTLDREMPQEKEKKRRGFLFFFFIGLGLLVAGAGTWYGIKQRNTSIIGTTQSAQKISPIVTTGNKTAPLHETSPIANTTTPAPAVQVATGHAPSPAENNAVAPGKENTTNTKKSVPLRSTGEQNITSGNRSTVALSGKQNHSIKNNTISNVSAAPVSSALSGSTHAAVQNTRFKNNLSGKGALPEPSTDGSTRVRKQHHGTSINSSEVIAGRGDGSETSIAQPAARGKHSKDKKPQQVNESSENTAATGTGTNDFVVITPVTPPKQTITDTTNINKTNKEKVALKDSLTAEPVVVIEKKDSAKAAKAKTKSGSKKERAVLLAVTGGIDYSTVRFRYGSDAGYNIGFLGGYQFNKHWSVYTGVVYTKKDYKLNGADYHPPQHYWTMYVDLQTVEGYCRMWDVPLLGRYTFNPQKKTSFFVSAGLSSYFMKKQQYEYSFKSNTTGMQGTSAWTDDSSFNHVFSILDLSAGFEKHVGKHMSWQVEPYAKIPLGGVGFGNIKLSSFGLNLTLQYRQSLKH